MARVQIPQNGNWSQVNDGETQGILKGTFNVDFDKNRGKASVSEPILAAYTQDNDADFDGYAGAIIQYSNDFYFFADEVFRTTTGTPTSSANWSKDSRSNVPSPNNTDTDAVVWNDYLLVIENNTSPAFGDIARLSGSTWDRNWWRSTLSASTDKLVKLVAAPDGNLYPVTETGKVHKLTPALAVTLTGEGTLDLSERPYTFTTAVANSTRMWIGFENEDNGTGGVIEWDLSATSISPNRTHQLSSPVRCLAVWNDIVIAILQNGKIKYNAGAGFVEWQGIELPHSEFPLDSSFINKNGWAIIDDLPHFLISFEQNTQDNPNNLTRTNNSIQNPAGIYCLDPEVGFYHRFAIGSGNSTPENFGETSVTEVGAMYSLLDSETTTSKLLCSYDVLDETSTDFAVLGYNDFSKSVAGKGYLAFNPVPTNEVAKKVELIHKKLTSGSSIRVFYRFVKEDDVRLFGTWLNTTQLNTTGSVSDINTEGIALVRYGSGAGQILRVDDVKEATTSTITFKDTNTFAAQNDETVLTFMNYKYMGTVDSSALDFHNFTFPQSQRARRVELLIEITQASGATEELDYIDLVI